MLCIFYLTFGPIGGNLQALLEQGIDWTISSFNDLLVSWNISEWLRALLIDGVCQGVGSVLSFLPVIVVLFFFLSCCSLYSPSRACVCLPPGFLTLWLYLPFCRFAHGCCRGLALCMFVILLRFPSAAAAGSLCACLLFFYAFPSAVAAGSLGFSCSLRGFALA